MAPQQGPQSPGELGAIGRRGVGGAAVEASVPGSQVRVLALDPLEEPLLRPRPQMQRPNTTREAPASAIRARASSSCVSPSVSQGMIGIRKTVTAKPASAAARTVASRASVVGVPGSTAFWSASSNTAIDIERSTGTRRAACSSWGRSRRRRVPLVRIDSGVPDSASASMIPGMSRYRPSARW